MATSISTEIAEALAGAVAEARSTGGTAQSSQSVFAEAVAAPVAEVVASVFAYVFRGDKHCVNVKINAFYISIQIENMGGLGWLQKKWDMKHSTRSNLTKNFFISILHFAIILHLSSNL